MFSADVPIWQQDPTTMSDYLWALLGYVIAFGVSLWFTRWAWYWDREWWYLALGAAGCIVFFFLAADAATDAFHCLFRAGCWIDLNRNRF